MTRKSPKRVVGCLLFCWTLVVILGTVPAAAFTSMSDDFSADSGNWSYVGDAHRTNGYIELVPNQAGKAGAVWLKQDVRYPFVVEFKAQTSSSGEGMVFLFHKDKAYTPAGGAKLGAAPATGSADGWGVEMDVKSSSGDDSPAPHLGLVGDPTGFHYKQDASVKFNDGKWHSFKIEIQWSTIILSMDGKEVWHFSDYSYKNAKGSGMGFSAASGGGGAFRVDDFKLQKPGEAEMWYWITFGVTIGAVFFGTLGGIVVWGSISRKRILKDYAQPGTDFSRYTLPSGLQKQILAAAKHSPDPNIKRLRTGYSRSLLGMRMASFLMMAVIFGTLFMPAILVLTLGVILMVVFIAIFGIASAIGIRRAKPFLVLMGQRMGFFQPVPYGQPGAPPMQPMMPPQLPSPPPVPPAQPAPSQPDAVNWGAPVAPPPGAGPQSYQPQQGAQAYQPAQYPGVGKQPYQRNAPAQNPPQRPPFSP